MRPPVANARAARYATLAARPDVQAAAAKYGVVRTIHLNPDVFTDQY